MLPRNERADIDAVTFTPIGRTDSMTWEQSLAANYTDGIVILHRGRIVYERYFGALAPDRQHIAFSVTKSFVATVAAMLIAEGKLDENATVARYLPEFQASGMGDATIRQLLDMTTGPDYTEDYTDPNRPCGRPRGPAAFSRARRATTGPSRSSSICRRCARRGRMASSSPTRPSTPTRSNSYCGASPANR